MIQNNNKYIRKTFIWAASTTYRAREGWAYSYKFMRIINIRVSRDGDLYISGPRP